MRLIRAGCGLVTARVAPIIGAGQDACRQLTGTLNTNPLGSAAFTREQMNLATRHTKMPGKEANQVAIGLAVDGRRGQPDLQTLAMGAIQ